MPTCATGRGLMARSGGIMLFDEPSMGLAFLPSHRHKKSVHRYAISCAILCGFAVSEGVTQFVSFLAFLAQLIDNIR